MVAPATATVDTSISSSQAELIDDSTGCSERCRANPMEVLASSKVAHLADRLEQHEFSLHKLQFARVELVGRERETALLKERLRKCWKDKTTELVLIGGASGCGKSSLAESFIQTEVPSAGAYAQGKFNQTADQEPYSILIDVCQELARKCLSDQALCQKLIQGLEEDLVGMEKQLLVQTLPLLFDHLQLQSHQCISSSLDANASKELLQSAFRKLLRLLAVSCFQPLVILLDDLQWSDACTLDLLQSILVAKDEGTRIPNLLFVGSYRSNEAKATKKLHGMVEALRQQDKKVLTEIKLSNLTVDQCSQILMTLMGMDDSRKIHSLAELCYQRTMGNPFFLLAFCKMLYLEELLTFHLGTFTWKWDMESIQSKTGAMDNVVELVRGQMERASMELLHLLQLAACLGNSFSAHSLSLVWLQLPIDEKDPASMPDQFQFKNTLENAIQQGFLERCGNGLRWIHDKIQEAAIELESREVFLMRQHQVGHILFSSYSPKELEEELFAMVNLLNGSGGEQSLLSSYELAKLNLRAANKASRMGAFAIQADYAQRGIANLQLQENEDAVISKAGGFSIHTNANAPKEEEGCWSTLHKDIALELYTLCAEAESCQGNYEKMQQLCNVVFRQPSCSSVDKAVCSHIVMESIARQGKLKEAISFGVDLVNDLGGRIPNNTVVRTVTGVSKLLRFQWSVKSFAMSAEDLAAMPFMMDPMHQQIMRILSRLTVYAYLAQDEMIQAVAGLLMSEMTLKYGLSDYSQYSFPGCAVILMHVLKDWKGAVKLARFGLAVHDRLVEHDAQPSTQQSAAIGIAYGVIISWVEPMRSQLSRLIGGYKQGMEVGDTEWAFANIVWYLELSLYSGISLQTIDADTRIYLPQFEVLRASLEYSTMVRSFWQASLNLMGHSNDTTSFTGVALNEANFDSSNLPERLMVMKSFVCVYFGDHELGAKLALERGDVVLGKRPGQPCVMVDPYLRAISLYSMARKKGKAKYKYRANKARAIVKGWVKKHQNPNSHHHLALLNAERAALSQRQETSELYNTAARLAARGGYIHDAALANERHAEYLLEAKQVDQEAVSHQLRESVERYLEWGATKKVQLLREKFKSFL